MIISRCFLSSNFSMEGDIDHASTYPCIRIITDVYPTVHSSPLLSNTSDLPTQACHVTSRVSKSSGNEDQGLGIIAVGPGGWECGEEGSRCISQVGRERMGLTNLLFISHLFAVVWFVFAGLGNHDEFSRRMGGQGG